MRLYRFENQFVLGPVSATEGFYVYASELAPPADVSDAIQALVGGWFIEPNPVSGVSRADLMPVEARFETSRLVSFALDLLEIESELYSAFLSIPAQRDVEPLPAVVSKEVEVYGLGGGRGRFNRIHTSFHPLDAVAPEDARLCSTTYQSQLVNVYAFLFDLINGTHVAPVPPFFRGFPLTVGYVQTPRATGTNHITEYRVFEAVRVGSASRRWGTMRRRGARVHH